MKSCFRCSSGWRAARQGGVCCEDSPGKMATAGSAERPGRPTSAAAGKYRSRSGAGGRSGSRFGSSPPENEPKKSAEGPHGGSPPCGHPARRHSGSGERLRRKSDPERSSSRPGRRDCDTRRGQCVHRADSCSQPAGPAPPLGLCPPERCRCGSGQGNFTVTLIQL